MTIEEIVHGESNNIEFKVELPKDSAKYIKTIIAFANTQGGRLVVGVDDETREAVGVDNDSAFEIMDRIANAVADSCEPQIIPNIELQTVDGQTVVVVTVAPEANRPYYLKSKGKEKGTFIRLAGTSRPASPERIKELEMEGARVSWDELTCIGYEDYFPFSKTQCAVFKGTERTVFLDKREFTGPLYEQIEGAIAFVLRNIRLGATIEGLVRKEDYELPAEAIREMIVNAHCHRNLADASCVQVAVYDDRLEVTSPGGFIMDLLMKRL